MYRQLLASLTAASICAAGPALAKAPDTWDGLVRVASKRADLVYLRPGADFRQYSRVMLDPPEIAFHKDWERDVNNSSRLGRVSDRDVRRAIDEGQQVMTDVFTKAFSKAGYQIVTAPDADVLRVSVGVVNLWVNAPDRSYPGRVRTYSQEAGQGTLVVEARDSLSGQLLGRAIDQKIMGDHGVYLRSSVSNWGDFQVEVERWAKLSAQGLSKLRSAPPQQ